MAAMARWISKAASRISCDVFFYEDGAAASASTRSRQARCKLGLGAATGIEMPGEHAGLIPSARLEAEDIQAWPGSRATRSAPASARAMSPPRRCSCAQQAARHRQRQGGRRRAWCIRWAAKLQPRPRPRSWISRDEALARVRGGMNRVTNEPGGTAYALRITEPGFEMAGKTGTAQVRAYTEEAAWRRHHQERELAWKLRDHALVHRLRAGGASQLCLRPASSSMASDGHPQVQMARDILLFTQKRDPLKHAHRLSASRRPSRRTAAPRGAADGASPLCRRQAHLVLGRQAAGSELGPGAADRA